MTTQNQEKTSLNQEEWSKAENERIDAAMRRAAKKARRRAIDNDGYVETWRDGKIVRDAEP